LILSWRSQSRISDRLPLYPLLYLSFQVLILTNSTTIEKVRTIDLTECLPDITSNIISASPEHYLLPSDIFEDIVFTAINELIDDFSLDPDKYLKPHHQAKIDRVAHDYIHS
jgi:hypothetical protein